MKKFLEKIHRSANQFSMVDFALFKIYIFAVGILVGAYFAPFWLTHISVVWVVAAASCVVVLTQLIRRYNTKL